MCLFSDFDLSDEYYRSILKLLYELSVQDNSNLSKISFDVLRVVKFTIHDSTSHGKAFVINTTLLFIILYYL